MDYTAALIIAIGLAMDAFSVCISAGMCIPKLNAGHYLRMSLAFGFFQFVMPVIGFFAGRTVEPIIRNYDHWIAFLLLFYIGAKMIYEGLKKDKDNCETKDPSRGKNLLILAIATSIDALAVGVSYGVLAKPILIPAIIIGVVCIAFSASGIAIGKRAGSLFGKKADIIGGLCLIAIGIKILFEHMF